MRKTNAFNGHIQLSFEKPVFNSFGRTKVLIDFHSWPYVDRNNIIVCIWQKL